MAVVASYRWYISSHWLYDNPQRFEDQNILNILNANILNVLNASCTQIAGTLASDVLEADRAVVPWRSWVRVHITG